MTVQASSTQLPAHTHDFEAAGNLSQVDGNNNIPLLFALPNEVLERITVKLPPKSIVDFGRVSALTHLVTHNPPVQAILAKAKAEVELKKSQIWKILTSEMPRGCHV